MNSSHLIATPHPAYASRRAFLKRTGSGFGLMALTAMLGEQGVLAAGAKSEISDFNSQALNPLAAKPSHFPAKAKSVIWLFMNGGQSQVDTWDYKPALVKADGRAPKGFDRTGGFFPCDAGPRRKAPFGCGRHGRSGASGGDSFPRRAQPGGARGLRHPAFLTPT